jgi:NADPH2:quinone reductase
MRAIRIYETGAPDVMRFEDVELAPPGPGQARVLHHAIGVNFLDIYYRSGLYPSPPLPFTPGNEGAGEIVAVGKGVKEFKPGDRVAYVAPLGSYAQERNVETRFLVKLPKAISYDAAAAMMLKGLTAQYLLRQTYKVQAGDTILVHAAAGGVGLILCQWAKALGAVVIGTVGSQEKAKLAK